MSYNLTLINSTGVISLTQTVNDNLMYGYLGSLFLVSIFFIALLSFNANKVEWKFSFSSAMTIVAILSMPLRVLELVTDVTVWTCWILLAFSIMIIFFTD